MDELYELNGKQYTRQNLIDKYGDRIDEAISKLGFTLVQQEKPKEQEKPELVTVENEPEPVEQVFSFKGRKIPRSKIEEKYGDRAQEAIDKFGFKEITVKKKEETVNMGLFSEPVSLASIQKKAGASENGTTSPEASEPEIDTLIVLNKERNSENITKARAIRKSVRDNGDGNESSVLMATETFDGKTWVSFPTLFPNDPESTSQDPKDWTEITDRTEAFEEAQKRGEVFQFGQDKTSALAFGEGAWKPEKEKPEPEPTKAEAPVDFSKINEDNKLLNWVERGLAPENFPKITNDDGTTSTHNLEVSEEDGKYIVYPTIIQDPATGRLLNLGDRLGRQHAKTNKSFIAFDNEKDALAYKENGLIPSVTPVKEKEDKEVSNELWNSRIQAENITEDFKEILKNPLDFKKEFIDSRDYDPNPKATNQDRLDDDYIRSIKERNNASSQEIKNFEEDILQRETTKFRLQREKSEREHTELILNKINDNNGDIEFLSNEQLFSLGINPLLAKTNAIKVNGEAVSVFDLNKALLDGDFVKDLKDGKINVSIDKEHRFLKDGFIPSENLKDTEALLIRQKESGNRFIDLGQHLAKSIVQLPAGILKGATGLIEETIDIEKNPGMKNALKLAGFDYDTAKKGIVGLDNFAEDIENTTQLYGDGIAKSIAKGNFVDAGFQIANAGFEMAPLIAVSMFQPELAPALFGAQAFGEKLSALQEEQRTAQYRLDNGYQMSPEEIKALKFSSLQKLSNAGAVGFLNYVLFGGYVRGLNRAGKIESFTGKSLTDLNTAMKLGYGEGFKKFAKEVGHQQKFFGKMNIGNFAIDKLTGANTTVTGESALDDAIKGVFFAIPFYATKTYKNNQGLKRAKTLLIDNLLSVSNYSKRQVEINKDIDGILQKLIKEDISIDARTDLMRRLESLTTEAETLHKVQMEKIDVLTPDNKEAFAIRYEKLLDRERNANEVGLKTDAGKALQKDIEKDKELYRIDLNKATAFSESKESEKTAPIKSDFDGTLYNNETGELTELGKDIKERIANGEDVTILTAREDTAENKAFIAEQLGIAPEKIKLGLSPEGKAENVNEGDRFYDDNKANLDAVNAKFPDQKAVDVKEEATGFEGIDKALKEAETEKDIKFARERINPKNEDKADDIVIGNKTLTNLLLSISNNPNIVSELYETVRTSLKAITRANKKYVSEKDVVDEEIGGFENVEELIFSTRLSKDINDINTRKKINEIVTDLEKAKGQTQELDLIIDLISDNRYNIFGIDNAKINNLIKKTGVSPAIEKQPQLKKPQIDKKDENKTQTENKKEEKTKETKNEIVDVKETPTLKEIAKEEAKPDALPKKAEKVEPEIPSNQKIINDYFKLLRENKVPKKQQKAIQLKLDDSARLEEAGASKELIRKNSIDIFNILNKKAETTKEINLQDKTYKVKKEGNEIIFVNPEAILNRLAEDSPDFDVAKKPIGNRVNNAKKALEEHGRDVGSGELEQSVVNFDSKGKITFTDGRHRILASKELGIELVPIEVPAKQAGKFKKDFQKQPAKAPVKETKARLGEPKKEAKEVKETETFDTKIGRYTVEVVDGEIKLNVIVGKKNPSDGEVKKVTEQYLDRNDFSKGEKANLEGVPKEAENEVIAKKSKNPQEIAVALKETKAEEAQAKEGLETTLEGVIADAMDGVIIDKSNHAEITDLSFPFKVGKGKRTQTLDQVRESAEERFKQEVDIDEVRKFLRKYKSVKDYREQNKETIDFGAKDLEARFKEITGLKATEKNIDAVIGEVKAKDKGEVIPDKIEEGDVPFQTESQFTKQQAKDLIKLVDRLKITGLASAVKILSDKAIADNLKKLGREFKETPLGFVDKDVVYINADKVKSDTAIHEFGELWTRYVEKTNKPLYDKGVELIKEDGTYLKRAKKNPNNKGLSEDQLIKDAMSQAIGERGVEIQNESNAVKFKAWFQKIFREIANGLGLSKMTGDQFSKLNLKDFARRAAAELLSKKQITEKSKLKKEVKTKVEEQDLTGIELVMSEQTALANAKAKIKEQLADKNAITKQVRGLLKDYITENLKRTQENEPNERTLKSILSALEETTTLAGLKRAEKKIDKIVVKLNKNRDKILQNKDKILQKRQEAIDKLANDKIKIKAKQKALLDYLGAMRDGRDLSDPSFKQAETLFKTINETETRNQFNRAMEKVDALLLKLETKAEKEVAKIDAKNRKDLETARNKRLALEQRRVAFERYVNRNIDKKSLEKLAKREFTKLQKAIIKIKTPRTLEKHLLQAEQILTEVESRKVFEKINTILNKALSKVKSGFIKANLTTEETKDILDGVKKAIKNIPKGIKEAIFPPFKRTKTKTQADALALELYINRINELKDEVVFNKSTDSKGVIHLTQKQNLTDKEIGQLESIDISLDILNAIKTKDVFLRNALYNKALVEITEIFEQGKSELKELRDEAKREFKEDLEEPILAETDPLDRRLEPENKNKNEKDLHDKVNNNLGFIPSLTNPLKIYLTSPFLNKAIRDLGAKAKQLSKIGEDINFSPIFRFIRSVNLAENEKTTHFRDARLEILDAKRRIFGDIIKKRPKIIKGKLFGGIVTDAKSLREFRKKITVTREIIKKDSEPEYDTISYPQDKMLDIYLKSLNPNNTAGLRATGYTAEVIADIKSQLTPKMLEYGDFLLDFYKKRYPRLNDVYKSLNFHSLGFQENYSGRTKREGYDDKDIDLSDPQSFFGTTTFGSLKTTTQNALKIEAMPVDNVLSEYVEGYAHYLSYAKIERNFSKLLQKNSEFSKAVILNNGTQGGYILDSYREFNNKNIKKSVRLVAELKAINWSHKRVVENILGGKFKSMFTQSASAITGLLSVPPLTLKQKAEVTRSFFKDARFLIKNSDLIKNRRDKDALTTALANTESTFKTNNINSSSNSDLTAYTHLMITSVHSAMTKLAFKPISWGDMLGVLGTTPVYRAYLIKLKEQNPNWTQKQIEAEAMAIFENTANNAQQSQTKGGKSEFQNNPYVRPIIAFSTTMFANYKNALSESLEIRRKVNNIASQYPTLESMLKGIGVDTELAKVSTGKGTLKGNTIRYMNFMFAQQVLYASITTGSVMVSINGANLLIELIFNYEDEETRQDILAKYTEQEKTVTASYGGVFQEIPLAGYMQKGIIDKWLLEKEKTYASVFPHIVKDKLDDMDEAWNTMNDTKNEKTRKKWEAIFIKEAMGIMTGAPELMLRLMTNYDELMEANDFTAYEKGKVYGGWSLFDIKSRKEKEATILKNQKKLLEEKASVLEEKELAETITDKELTRFEELNKQIEEKELAIRKAGLPKLISKLEKLKASLDDDKLTEDEKTDIIDEIFDLEEEIKELSGK